MTNVMLIHTWTHSYLKFHSSVRNDGFDLYDAILGEEKDGRKANDKREDEIVSFIPDGNTKT